MSTGPKDPSHLDRDPDPDLDLGTSLSRANERNARR